MVLLVFEVLPDISGKPFTLMPLIPVGLMVGKVVDENVMLQLPQLTFGEVPAALPLPLLMTVTTLFDTVAV